MPLPLYLCCRPVPLLPTCTSVLPTCTPVLLACRTMEYVKQQQTALKLNKATGESSYMWWVVLALVLQAAAAQRGRPGLMPASQTLALAQGMLERLLKASPVDSQEELLLYMDVLQGQVGGQGAALCMPAGCPFRFAWCPAGCARRVRCHVGGAGGCRTGCTGKPAAAIAALPAERATSMAMQHPCLPRCTEHVTCGAKHIPPPVHALTPQEQGGS
jgi:hypothetical protein